MRYINNYNFANKKTIIRVDFNVPICENTKNIVDDTKIRASIPTIEKIIKDKGSVILMSHLGRPQKISDKLSLKPVVERLAKLFII